MRSPHGHIRPPSETKLSKHRACISQSHDNVVTNSFGFEHRTHIEVDINFLENSDAESLI